MPSSLECVLGYEFFRRDESSGRFRELVPEDEQTSISEIQQELSLQFDLTRILWLPSNVRSEDSRQRRVLDRVQNRAPSEPGTELLIGNIEDLKTEIVTELNRLSSRLERKEPAPDTFGRVAAVTEMNVHVYRRWKAGLRCSYV